MPLQEHSHVYPLAANFRDVRSMSISSESQAVFLDSGKGPVKANPALDLSLMERLQQVGLFNAQDLSLQEQEPSQPPTFRGMADNTNINSMAAA